MSPDNLASFVGFLVLLAPGLLYQLLRERRTPGYKESAFREASHVALTSVLLSGAALAVLLLARMRWPQWFPDLNATLNTKHYAAKHYGLVARFVTAHFVVACGLALAASRVATFRSPGHLVSTSVWWEVFRGDRPRRHVPWVYAQLDDGGATEVVSEVMGFLSDYTPEPELDNRELSLKGPALKVRRRDSEGQLGPWRTLNKWDRLVVRGDAIRLLQVSWEPQIDLYPASPSLWRRLVSDRAAGWVVAAALLALLVVRN